MILKKKTFNQINDIDYLVYLPDEYYNDEKSYPLVLFLHGAGERGNNVDSIKKHGIPKRIEEGAHFPFITIAPQCRDGIWWSNRENINILEKLMNCSILDLKVDEKRIYGTGLSMGGFGILELALKVPSLFTDIVAICYLVVQDIILMKIHINLIFLVKKISMEQLYILKNGKKNMMNRFWVKKWQ